MRVILTAVLVFCLGLSGFAQDTRTYKTRDGKLGISIYYNDSLLSVGSNKLRVLIDNETRDILIAVNPSTLKTKVDSLDRKLSTGIYNDVVFKGQMGIDQLETKGRSAQQFEVSGDLMINGRSKFIAFQARLSNYEEAPGVGSLLYLHYDIELKDFGLDELLPGFAEQGCVEILQGLMVPTSH